MSNRYQEGYVNGCRKTRDEMQAEIERLRAALTDAPEPTSERAWLLKYVDWHAKTRKLIDHEQRKENSE